MSETAAASAAPPRKKRPPPRKAEVLAVETVTPKLLRIRFGGEMMRGFAPPRPSAHIKILFEAEPGTWTPDSDLPRPPSRTYTPRSFDADAAELEVEFVLHGEGLASTWAERAKVGDTVWIGGPGGGLDLDPGLSHIVMIADETSMPAAGMLLEAMPAGCAATVLCEIADAAEERPLGPAVAATPRWLHRGSATPASLLEQALPGIEAPDGALWWIATEAGAIRRMRRHLMAERGIDRTRVVTRGYWLAGESNHPDHDYGEDG